MYIRSILNCISFRHIQFQSFSEEFFVKPYCIRNWNQLPASLLASFPCKLSTFRKSVKNVVTSKGIQVRGERK